MIDALRVRRGSSIGLMVLVLCLLIGASVAKAEDPGIQRDMAVSYGEKLGLSVDAAQARLNQQDRLIPVADQVRKEMGDAYAGIWFDNADGGRMKVGVAAATSDTDPALVQRVQAILAANGATNDADLVRVAFTEAELAAQQDKINAALGDELHTGQVSTSLDTSKNAVIVKVASDASAATQANVAQAVSAARGSAQIQSGAAVQAHFNTCVARSGDNALFCGNPFRGAVDIGANTGSVVVTCSAGFVTIGNGAGNPYLLTAGHCLRDSGSATWSSRDASLTLHNIGNAVTYTLGSGGDFGITSFSTAYWQTSPYVVYDGASTWNETYHIYSADTSYIGMAICGSGKNLLSNGHYTACGTVTNLNVTAYTGSDTIQHLGEANTCTGVDGNSGGPFYKNGYGYGLQSVSWSTCDIGYQGLSSALSGSNVHLVG